MSRKAEQVEKMAAKRKSDTKDNQLTPGLNEEDPEAHTRPDKRSLSSRQPELPIAEADANDDDEPPRAAEESATTKMTTMRRSIVATTTNLMTTRRTRTWRT